MAKLILDSMNVSSYLNELKINGISESTLEYYTSVLKDVNIPLNRSVNLFGCPHTLSG